MKPTDVSPNTYADFFYAFNIRRAKFKVNDD